MFQAGGEEIIGIFGGAFNPPHIGHLILAEETLKKLNLKKIIFVPSGKSPHKPVAKESSEVRLRLTTLATVSNDLFSVSDYETKKEPVSYTIDTLRYFGGRFNGKIVFLMGMDSLADMKNWKNCEELLESYMIAVWRRPGAVAPEEASSAAEKVTFLDTPEIPVSSSDIRGRIRSGGHYRYLVGEKVYFYINAMELYR